MSTNASKTMCDSDLSDEEWGLIEHHFQRQDNRGARSVHAKRDVVNAILYLNKTGAQWRMLPKSFPPWQTVYADSREWNWRGAWEKALDELNALHRKSYAIIDSQGVNVSTGWVLRLVDLGWLQTTSW